MHYCPNSICPTSQKNRPLDSRRSFHRSVPGQSAIMHPLSDSGTRHKRAFANRSRGRALQHIHCPFKGQGTKEHLLIGPGTEHVDAHFPFTNQGLAFTRSYTSCCCRCPGPGSAGRGQYLFREYPVLHPGLRRSLPDVEVCGSHGHCSRTVRSLV